MSPATKSPALYEPVVPSSDSSEQSKILAWSATQPEPSAKDAETVTSVCQLPDSLDIVAENVACPKDAA